VGRRAQFLPWKAAGRVTERQASGDDVVRATGWVFNNESGHHQTLAEFVHTGDVEVGAYLAVFGLSDTGDDPRHLVEIGCGIGRMTCAFTRRFHHVTACDLDAGVLERCRESVAQFGRPDRLDTVEVGDGRTLELRADSVDIAFSYITMQHCDREDALALSAEAARIVRPGGRVALNYRRRSGVDIVLLPLGALVRAVFSIPGLGTWLSKRRGVARFAWQTNRLSPDQVLAAVGAELGEAQVWHNPTVHVDALGAEAKTFAGINPSHWWLIGTTRR